MATTADKVCFDLHDERHIPLLIYIPKIKDIEAEMAKTQKNKATSYHLGTGSEKQEKIVLLTYML